MMDISKGLGELKRILGRQLKIIKNNEKHYTLLKFKDDLREGKEKFISAVL